MTLFMNELEEEFWKNAKEATGLEEKKLREYFCARERWWRRQFPSKREKYRTKLEERLQNARAEIMMGHPEIQPNTEPVSEEMLDQYIAEQERGENVKVLVLYVAVPILVLLGIIKMFELATQWLNP